MNQQERQALQDFLQELVQARLTHKDREAEAMISHALARQPNAAYLLVQRALLQEQALNAAQREIAALQSELEHEHSSHRHGFFDTLANWGRSSRRMARYGHAQSASAYSSPYHYSSGAYSVPPPRPGLLSSGSGSFLGTMAATAAGVAAGSFLFHGIDQLLHDHDHFGDAGAQNFADSSEAFGGSDQFFNDPGYTGGLGSDAGMDDIGGFDDTP